MKKVRKGKHRATKPKRRIKPKPQIKSRVHSTHLNGEPVGKSVQSSLGANNPQQTQTERLTLAAAALGRGDPHSAFDICREMLTLSPFDTGALNLAGVAAFQAGLAAEALELLQKAVSQSPQNAEVQTNLGNVLAHLGKESAATLAYEKAMQADPDYAEAFFNFGILMEGSGQPEKAIVALNKALEKEPHHVLALHGLGNAFKTLSRLEEAKAAFQAALKIDPSLSMARTNLAAVLYEIGDFKGATEESQRAIKINPDLYEAQYNLGTALQELGRHDEAITAYEQVLIRQPKHAAAAMNIAYGLQQMGRLDAASTAFEKAISIDPSFAKAYVNLADLRLQQGDPLAALAVCDGFLKDNPGKPDLLAFKAMVLGDAGEKKTAADLIDYDRFLKLQSIKLPAGYSDLATFNAALGAHVASHPTLNYAPQSHATRAGQHSGELLAEPKGPFAEMEKLILNAVDKYKKNVEREPSHPFLGAQPEKMRLSIWGVIMRAAGHQIPHIHPAAWLSGVYYADVPAIVGEEVGKQAGWLVLGRPPDHFHNSRDAEIKAIRPEPGLMVLFPSYFYHQTIPFHTDETRISIAFDLIPD